MKYKLRNIGINQAFIWYDAMMEFLKLDNLQI